MPHIHFHDDRLKCPYKGCGREFDRPTVLTDNSTYPRQTHYACPHCQSKIEVVVDGFKVVDIKPTEYPKVFESPAKCAHYSSLVSSISRDMMMPDDCLLCPKVLQCSIRQSRK